MGQSAGRTRALFTGVMTALWLALTVYETLRPVGWIQHVPFWAFFVENMAGADLVQNLVLFAPAGWIAHRAGWSFWRSVLAAFLISSSIEFLQQWVPGRTTTAMDIACNTTGAALGWWMATSVARPRLRLAGLFGALAAFMGLHVLNTSWPDLVERADGAGNWQRVNRHICASPARESTACLSVPNTATGGDKYVRVVGPNEHTYARVQGDAIGRRMGPADCVTMLYESTTGAALHLRMPQVRACALAAPTDSVVELRVDPRLEHQQAGAWTPTRASVWMWPVWPFTEYRPGLLRVAGAVTFVVVGALMIGEALWVLPAGYLLVLVTASVMVGLRGPGWWDVGWTGIGWLAALMLVQIDQWWRQRSPV